MWRSEIFIMELNSSYRSAVRSFASKAASTAYENFLYASNIVANTTSDSIAFFIRTNRYSDIFFNEDAAINFIGDILQTLGSKYSCYPDVAKNAKVWNICNEIETKLLSYPDDKIHKSIMTLLSEIYQREPIKGKILQSVWKNLNLKKYSINIYTLMKERLVCQSTSNEIGIIGDDITIIDILVNIIFELITFDKNTFGRILYELGRRFKRITPNQYIIQHTEK